MPSMRLSVLAVFLLIAFSQEALAQPANPSPSTTTWNIDIAGAVGVRVGLGALNTSVDLSGGVTVFRATHTEPFEHRCLGVTAMFVGASGERAVFVGPRWDTGDDDGTVFARILAGPRKLSFEGFEDETTLGVGGGVGLAVGPLSIDVNWIMSPWTERGSQRVSVSLGYIWSIPITRNHD